MNKEDKLAKQIRDKVYSLGRREDFEPVIPIRKSNFDRILKEVREQTKQKIIEVIKKLKNPYPLDIFPKLELTSHQSQAINNYLKAYFDFPLDRLSAEMMRRARENVKQELLKSIEEI